MNGRRRVIFESFWVWSSLQFAVVFSIIVHSKSDSRCFLVNGGSSVSFFVSEDAPIGSNLGMLQIHGDVTRDIILSLREKHAPVRIEPGTKNITLTSKLDREGVAGPSTVTFTVLCDKKNYSNEPSIHIPVTIRVTDVNDNAPRIIGGPFRINVSEQTLPGSAILSNIKATDMDQQGPYSTLTFSALDSMGKPSSLVAFAGGGQEGRLLLTRPLDYETLPRFNVTLRVSDQGINSLHSETFVDVRVMDADDQNPRFQHVSYSALLPRNPRGGTPLEIEPEPIYAFDQDTGIKSPILYSIEKGRSAESQFFHMDPSTGRITITRDIPEDQLIQSTTLVLKAEQRDNPDRHAISTLIVGKQGNVNSPLHFVQPKFEVAVLENSPTGTNILTALTSRPADKRLKFGIEGDIQQKFQVGPMGEVVLKQPLDYEVAQRHTFRMWVTDGYQNSSADITVRVINVNDWAPRFRQGLYEFNVSTSKLAKGASIGQIEVADGDVGDKLSLEVQNSDSILVDDNGKLYLRNKTVVKREMMFIVVAKDTGDPPRAAFVPVIVRLVDMPRSEDVFLSADFDLKLILIAAFALTAFALAVGIVVYFGYCRKRRKIETENFHKRVLERNISNPLAIHKLGTGTLRRSNKIRQVGALGSPILNGSTFSTNGGGMLDSRGGLTPVDPINTSPLPHNRPKNVTWSPKVVQKSTPNPPARSENTRVTSAAVKTNGHANGVGNGHIIGNGHHGRVGLELDPDTSVTPLETYRNHQANGKHNMNPNAIPNGTDTLHSNTSLTLYF